MTVERLAVLQQLGRTYRAMLGAFEQRIGHGLPRWRILLRLHEFGQPCPQKRLVEALHIDPGALTRLLKGLETDGWIRRSADAADNRISNVELTEEGRHQVEACLPRRAAFIDDMLGDVPEQDLQMLAQLLAKLEARLRGDTPPHQSCG